MDKYANQYLSSLIQAIKGAPLSTAVYGGIGSLTGAGIGALRDPGVDEEGNRKGRLSNIMTGAAIGGLAGGGLGYGAASGIKYLLNRNFPNSTYKAKYVTIGDLLDGKALELMRNSNIQQMIRNN